VKLWIMVAFLTACVRALQVERGLCTLSGQGTKLCQKHSQASRFGLINDGTDVKLIETL